MFRFVSAWFGMMQFTRFFYVRSFPKQKWLP